MAEYLPDLPAGAVRVDLLDAARQRLPVGGGEQLDPVCLPHKGLGVQHAALPAVKPFAHRAGSGKIALVHLGKAADGGAHADGYAALRFAAQLHDGAAQAAVQHGLKLRLAHTRMFPIDKNAQVHGGFAVKLKLPAKIGQSGTQDLLEHPLDQAQRVRGGLAVQTHRAQHLKRPLGKMIIVIFVDDGKVFRRARRAQQLQKLQPPGGTHHHAVLPHPGLRACHNLPQHAVQLFFINGLQQIIAGPVLHGRAGVIEVAKAAHHHDLHLRPRARKRLHQLDAVHARHFDIADEDIRRIAAQVFQHLFPAGEHPAGREPQLVPCDQILDQGTDMHLVVCDQHLHTPHSFRFKIVFGAAARGQRPAPFSAIAEEGRARTASTIACPKTQGKRGGRRKPTAPHSRSGAAA